MIALLHIVKEFIADRLLLSRGCFLFNSLLSKVKNYLNEKIIALLFGLQMKRLWQAQNENMHEFTL